MSDAELDPGQAALIAGWRHTRREDWQAVEELDASLSRIGPSDPLYLEATRLRVEQRLQADDPQVALEAVELASALLARRWDTGDVLLHARATLRARDFEAALRSLEAVANRASARGVARTRRGKVMAERVLEIGRALPEEQYAVLRNRLRWARTDGR